MSKFKTLLFRPTLLGRMRREIVELSSISKQGGELRSYTATHLLSSRAPVCWVLQVVQGNVSVLTPALSREAAVNAVKVTATTSWVSLTRESERGWGVTTRCSQPAAGCVQSLHAGFYNVQYRSLSMLSLRIPLHFISWCSWTGIRRCSESIAAAWLGLGAGDSSMQRVESGQIWSPGSVCNSCQADGAGSSRHSLSLVTGSWTTRRWRCSPYPWLRLMYARRKHRFSHGIMGRRLPDGGLLRYRKWDPQ